MLEYLSYKDINIGDVCVDELAKMLLKLFPKLGNNFKIIGIPYKHLNDNKNLRFNTELTKTFNIYDTKSDNVMLFNRWKNGNEWVDDILRFFSSFLDLLDVKTNHKFTIKQLDKTIYVKCNKYTKHVETTKKGSETINHIIKDSYMNCIINPKLIVTKDINDITIRICFIAQLIEYIDYNCRNITIFKPMLNLKEYGVITKLKEYMDETQIENVSEIFI